MQAIKCVVLGDGAVGKLSKINDFYVFNSSISLKIPIWTDNFKLHAVFTTILQIFDKFLFIVFGEPSLQIELSKLVETVKFDNKKSNQFLNCNVFLSVRTNLLLTF